MAEEIYMTKEEYASDEQGVVKDAKFAYQAGEAAASKLAENSFYLDGKGPTWYASKDTLDGVQISANNAHEAANNAQSAANNAQASATLAQTMTMDKVSKSDVVQTVGTSDTAVMSQKAVTDLLDEKIAKTDILQETGSDENKVMSQKAVTDAISSELTEADEKFMLKSVYDTNGNGIVDNAVNAEKLGGILASEFVKKVNNNAPNTEGNVFITSVAKADDADKFGGQLPNYYAVKSATETEINALKNMWGSSDRTGRDANTLPGDGWWGCSKNIPDPDLWTIWFYVLQVSISTNLKMQLAVPNGGGSIIPMYTRATASNGTWQAWLRIDAGRTPYFEYVRNAQLNLTAGTDVIIPFESVLNNNAGFTVQNYHIIVPQDGIYSAVLLGRVNNVVNGPVTFSLRSDAGLAITNVFPGYGAYWQSVNMSLLAILKKGQKIWVEYTAGTGTTAQFAGSTQASLRVCKVGNLI